MNFGGRFDWFGVRDLNWKWIRGVRLVVCGELVREEVRNVRFCICGLGWN